MLITVYILFLFGLVMGSFLNVIIYRLPRGESIISPPSHCSHCQHRLGITDLFPVLSFIFLSGRCRYCQALISWHYPLVELLSAGLTVLCWLRFGFTPDFGAALVLTYVMIVIALIDLDLQIIPNWLTLPMVLFGLVFRGWQGEFYTALAGGLVGGGILFLIVLVYPKGMGMGDVKFLAMAGVFLGWEKILVTLFLSSLLGILVMVPLLALKKIDRKIPFPFGPFLVLASLINLYWGEIYKVFFRLSGS